MSNAPETVVIMMSGHATIDDAVKATRLGAFDFLEKPVSLERLLVLLRNASSRLALASENRRLRHAWEAPIIGRSSAIRACCEEIERAGASTGARADPGRARTGRSWWRARSTPRVRGARTPFVAVNCSAIPRADRVRAVRPRARRVHRRDPGARGRFEEAHGGTLFLDEVADLSPRARPSCCACCRRVSWRASAAAAPCAWMSASSPPRIAIWRSSPAPGRSAKISTSGWQ
jgi:two-component system nitrogen regulation response regulator NtrX